MTLFPHMLQYNINSLERPILHLPARSKQASCVLLPRSIWTDLCWGLWRILDDSCAPSPFQGAVVSLGKIASSSAFFSQVRLVKIFDSRSVGKPKRAGSFQSRIQINYLIKILQAYLHSETCPILKLNFEISDFQMALMMKGVTF